MVSDAQTAATPADEHPEADRAVPPVRPGACFGRYDPGRACCSCWCACCWRLPATILITPDQHVTVAGQDIGVGARIPNLSWSGPAQLVQIGNTQLDIVPLRVIGPLRPKLTLGPVQRNAEAVAALQPDNRADARRERGRRHHRRVHPVVPVGGARPARAHRGSGRRGQLPADAVDAAAREPRRGRGADRDRSCGTEVATRSAACSIASTAVTTLAWAACGVLAYTGAVNGMRQVSSLQDLVGSQYLAPTPVGPAVEGFVGAVIGDSRAARDGGPLVGAPTEADRACGRSLDSLAQEIGGLISAPVANLACSGATIPNGLRGPQSRGGQILPPQVGLLKQFTGLKFVVVVIGPNDLSWGDQLRYCYGVADCHDRLTGGEFTYRLAAFDHDYGDLLHDLNDLPGSPQVIIMTSYDIFAADADCPDALGPPGAIGLSPQNIELLRARNVAAQRRARRGRGEVRLRRGPAGAHAAVPGGRRRARAATCRGWSDPAPFHPTGIGVLRMASSVVRSARRRDAGLTRGLAWTTTPQAREARCSRRARHSPASR